MPHVTGKKRKTTAHTQRKQTDGEHAVTIHNVARRAAVSAATVSRVLNNPERVREKTRARVQKAMQELAFVPNLIASSLARNRSECIGLIVPNLGAFFAPLVSEIEKIVRAEGSHLIIATGRVHGDDVARTVTFLKQRRCDAIILYPGAADEPQVLAMLEAEPGIVLVHRSVSRFRERCVAVDNAAGARLATRHLIDCGHRTIAVITGPSNNTESSERWRGFEHTMISAGINVDPDLIVEGDFETPSGERAIARLLARGKPFSALFCFSDEMAAGAIAYLRSVGKVLPDDLSIVGFDDFPFANQLYPRLTTVHQPIFDIGRLAAERALALSNRVPIQPGPSVLQPRLVVRDSVIPLHLTRPQQTDTALSGPPGRS